MTSRSDETIEVAGDWPMIEAQLPSNWREVAREHGLDPGAVPAQLCAKVDDVSVPLRLVLFHVGTNTSLKTTTAMAAAAGLIDISAVALHKWMRKMGAFLAALLVVMTDAAKSFAAEAWGGYEILIVDASSVTRPGSEGTTARVHYVVRLVDLEPVGIEVTNDKGGETFRRFKQRVHPGQLWMGDRGYANPPGVESVTSRGADVLVRYNRGSLPLYDVDGESLDVRTKMTKLRKPCRPRQWAAWVHPQSGKRIRGRLCALRLPPDKAEQARARLRREKGAQVTFESLEMAAFVILFTTVPQDRLSLDRVIELYTLRWQVELKIKRDKSIAGLDRLPNFREDTIRSWILAKMLLTQIAHRVTTPRVNIPPCAAA
jgi:transposase-like protein